jgi:hypothetical protein
MEGSMKIKAVLIGVSLLVLGAGAANAAGPFWLGVNAGAGIPTGDYGDAAATGWNIGATGTRMVNDKWGIGADVGYHSWGASDQLKATLAPGDEFKWSAIQATGHGMLRIPTQSNVKPYLKAGLGLYDVKGSLTSSTGDVSTSKSKLGFNFGGGMHVMTHGNMMWGVNGTYHIISAKNDFGSNVDAFSLGINLMWGVGSR